MRQEFLNKIIEECRGIGPGYPVKLSAGMVRDLIEDREALLEACIFLINHLMYVRDTIAPECILPFARLESHTVLEQARRAIAKAQGESK